MHRNILLLLVIVSIGWAQPEAWARSDPKQASAAGAALDPKAVLGKLCAAHANEPLCGAQETLSADQAWLVLDFVCRSAAAASTEPCTVFRPRSGLALRHDFSAGTWTAQSDSVDYKVEFDVAGTPTLRLRPRDARPLRIVIDEVSPLTYSVSPGTPKEEDLAVLSGLKTFLSLAGTGLQSVVQTLAYSNVSPFGPDVDLEKILEDAKTKGLAKGIGGKAPNIPPPPPKAICDVPAPDVLPAADFVRARMSLLSDVGSKTTALRRHLDTLSDRRQAFIKAAQLAEDGSTVTAGDLVRPDLKGLESAFSAFELAVGDLETQTQSIAACGAMLDAYQVLLGAPPSGVVVGALAARVTASGTCGGAAIGPLTDSLRKNAQVLVDAGISNPSTCSSADVKAAIELQRDAMKPLIERISGAQKAEEKVWAAIDKTRESRTSVSAGARQLDRVVNEGLLHTWEGQLIRSLAVTRQNPKLSWNKIQSHEVIIKADTPFLKELDLAKGAEEHRPFKLESAMSSFLGYGVGVVYTTLQDPAFGAVASPGGTDKVIAKVSQETRAGALAAFLTLRPMERLRKGRPFQVTMDLGVALSADHPAFFIGPGFEISKTAHFGVGWALQRVTKLSAGQAELQTVVSSKDDIRTERAFDIRHIYAAFSLSFDSLSLFGSK